MLSLKMASRLSLRRGTRTKPLDLGPWVPMTSAVSTDFTNAVSENCCHNSSLSTWQIRSINWMIYNSSIRDCWLMINSFFPSRMVMTEGNDWHLDTSGDIWCVFLQEYSLETEAIVQQSCTYNLSDLWFGCWDMGLSSILTPEHLQHLQMSKYAIKKIFT